MMRIMLTGVASIACLSSFNALAADSNAAYEAVTRCYQENASSTCSFLSVDAAGKSVITKDQQTQGGSIIILDRVNRASTVNGDLPGGSISGADDGLDAAVPDPEVELAIDKSEMVYQASGQIMNGGKIFQQILTDLGNSQIGATVNNVRTSYSVGVLVSMEYPIVLKKTARSRTKPSGCLFGCDYKNKDKQVYFRNTFTTASVGLDFGGVSELTAKLPTFLKSEHDWADNWDNGTPLVYGPTPKCTINYSNRETNGSFSRFEKELYYAVPSPGTYTLQAVCMFTVDVFDIMNGTYAEQAPANLYAAFRPFLFLEETSNSWYNDYGGTAGQCQYMVMVPQGEQDYGDKRRCNANDNYKIVTGWPTGGNIVYNVEAWGYVR